jgi:hypothetical protein
MPGNLEPTFILEEQHRLYYRRRKTYCHKSNKAMDLKVAGVVDIRSRKRSIIAGKFISGLEELKAQQIKILPAK